MILMRIMDNDNDSGDENRNGNCNDGKNNHELRVYVAPEETIYQSDLRELLTKSQQNQHSMNNSEKDDNENENDDKTKIKQSDTKNKNQRSRTKTNKKRIRRSTIPCMSPRFLAQNPMDQHQQSIWFRPSHGSTSSPTNSSDS